jgi:large subunit ribosomal protein L35Ae
MDKTNKINKNCRMYVKARMLGYKRAQRTQYPRHALIKIDGVQTKESTKFYIGKRCAYVYKAPTVRDGSRFRVMWGKIRRPHGNIGVVRATFKRNLPPKSFGAPIRVMLYPSNI